MVLIPHGVRVSVALGVCCTALNGVKWNALIWSLSLSRRGCRDSRRDGGLRVKMAKRSLGAVTQDG